MNAPTLGGALHIEAELHRLRGEFAMAERAYERANSFGCQPQPGMALLRLAQGRVDVATAQLRRRLAESGQPIDRARILCAASEILVAADDIEGARAAADELSSIATQLGSPLLRAHAELATGSALLASGDAVGALVALRRAVADWIELRMPREQARTRLLIADACDALGDPESAEMERRARKFDFGIACGDQEEVYVAGRGPDRAGDRGVGARRAGKVQPGDRDRTVYQREDRCESPQPHLHQARALVALGRDGVRLPARPRVISSLRCLLSMRSPTGR